MAGESLACDGDDGRIEARDEFPPIFSRTEVLEERVVDADARAGRLVGKRHSRLLGRAAGLAVVAGLASGNKIFPGVLSAPMAREHVIKGELAGSFAAVNAGPAVASKDFFAGEPNLGTGAPDKTHEPDDRREGNRLRGTADGPARSFEDLGFTAEDEDERPPDGAHVQRLVVLVEHEDGTVH